MPVKFVAEFDDKNGVSTYYLDEEGNQKEIFLDQLAAVIATLSQVMAIHLKPKDPNV